MTPEQQELLGIAHINNPDITMTQWLRSTAAFRIIGMDSWDRMLAVADELDAQAARIAELEGALEKIMAYTALDDQPIGPRDREFVDIHEMSSFALGDK